MKLFELFDNSVKYDVVEDNHIAFVATSRITTGLLEVVARKMGSSWGISFSVDDNYEMTGSGSEFEIFGVVVNILVEFCSKKKPAHLIMSSDEPSRIKLYRRMVSRLAIPEGFAVVEYQEPLIGTKFFMYKMMVEKISGSGDTWEVKVYTPINAYMIAANKGWVDVTPTALSGLERNMKKELREPLMKELGPYLKTLRKDDARDELFSILNT